MREFYGKRLQQARRKEHLTQKQAAERLKISTAAISRYEKEKSLFNIQLLFKFCRLYNISADYILGLRKGMPYPKK